MKTLLETLQGGAKYLEGRGVEDARANMEALAAKVLGCGRLDLYMDFDRPMAEAELAPLRELLKRRGERVPLQHLLGSVEFLGREFKCDARALIPRPETEELVGMLITRFKDAPPASVVDVGCGSGAIGLSLAAEWPDAAVTLVDRSPEALALTGENAVEIGLAEGRVEILEGDLLEGLEGRFDLVVANLPYIDPTEEAGLQAEVTHDPAMALYAEDGGIALIRRLIADLPGKLAPGGLVALEIADGQGDEGVRLLEAANLREAQCVKDLSGSGRFLLALR